MLSIDEIIGKIDQQEEACVLLAAIELRIYSILEKRYLSPREICRKTKTHLESTERLLYALAGLGALRLRKGKFGNTSVTYTYLCESSPQYKKGMVMLRQSHREEWESLLRVVRRGRDLSEYEGGDDPEFRRLFTYAMHERSERISGEIARIICRQPVGHVLDLGGGPGSYSAALLKRDKKATATLFDRASAVNVAREVVGGMKLLRRFEFITGDMFENSLGKGYSSVLFSNILHIYNPAQNKKLLRKMQRSLNPGGRLLIVDFFLDERRTEPLDAVMFNLTMLLFTARGKVYTRKETAALLLATGFKNPRFVPIGQGAYVLEAKKK